MLLQKRRRLSRAKLLPSRINYLPDAATHWVDTGSQRTLLAGDH